MHRTKPSAEGGLSKHGEQRCKEVELHPCRCTQVVTPMSYSTSHTSLFCSFVLSFLLFSCLFSALSALFSAFVLTPAFIHFLSFHCSRLYRGTHQRTSLASHFVYPHPPNFHTFCTPLSTPTPLPWQLPASMPLSAPLRIFHFPLVHPLTSGKQTNHPKLTPPGCHPAATGPTPCHPL